ncbi:hypothetical protein AB8896_00675 [Yersinia enterocolitica]|uniref:hypothetical protein n=1 Tax=Yersinia enterocolitica TaxID=630 RepID=UPI003D05FD12
MLNLRNTSTDPPPHTNMMPAVLAGIFHLMPEFIKSEFVFAPHAITRHGEWVTPLTAAQEDYDILFCEYCRLKISVVIDELTGVKSFVHTPGNLDGAKQLSTCRFSSANNRQKSKSGGNTQETQLGIIKPCRLHCNTTIQSWRCFMCNTCWHGNR